MLNLMAEVMHVEHRAGRGRYGSTGAAVVRLDQLEGE